MCCVVEYVGTAYAGFQKQPGKVTVQATLEQAIASVTQESVGVAGSGRTDAGAHALHQVITFSTESHLSPQQLFRAINSHLPNDVVLTSAREVPREFHPRFDAVSRVYRYRIWNREIRSPFWENRAAWIRKPLDVDQMQLAAEALVGYHDFGAFVPAIHKGDRRRRMDAIECRRDEHLVTVELAASGFMRQMVRSIAGTLILVGMGRIAAASVRDILASGDRDRAGETAPACGLYLVDVEYPAGVGGERSEEKE